MEAALRVTGNWYWISLTHARFLAPLEKARGFELTPLKTAD